MRFKILAAVTLTLVACAPATAPPQTRNGCAREATHAITWTDASAPDIVTARAEGPSCAQAIVTLTIRDATGDPLLAFADTYDALVSGGPPPEDAPAPTTEQIDAFLANWADVTQMNASALPAWRDDAPSLTASAQGFSYETPFTREAYEMVRERDLPLVCFAAAVEGSQCLVIDPATGEPARLVSYGP